MRPIRNFLRDEAVLVWVVCISGAVVVAVLYGVFDA